MTSWLEKKEDKYSSLRVSHSNSLESFQKNKSRAENMKILVACRRMLALVGLSTSHSVIIIGRDVPLVIIRFVVLAFQVFHLILHTSNCIVFYNSDIDAFLTAIHCVAAIVSNALVYTSLIVKSGEIMDLFAVIQMVVDERRYLRMTSKFLEGQMKRGVRKNLGSWKKNINSFPVKRKCYCFWRKSRDNSIEVLVLFHSKFRNLSF